MDEAIQLEIARSIMVEDRSLLAELATEAIATAKRHGVKVHPRVMAIKRLARHSGCG